MSGNEIYIECNPTFIEPSNPILEPESAEEDSDWVIVKQQKITILVPPAPYEDSHSENPEISAILAEVPSADGTQTGGVILKAQESNHRHAASVGNETQAGASGYTITKPTLQVAQHHIHGDGNTVVPSSKSFGGSQKPPIGSLSIANQRLRAMNLEKKLKKLGGFRTWLSSQGLGRFIRFFEKERAGKYQMANLTMSKLKGLGFVAVGPRRKLIHAINCLCQPYYSSFLQLDA